MYLGNHRPPGVHQHARCVLPRRGRACIQPQVGVRRKSETRSSKCNLVRDHSSTLARNGSQFPSCNPLAQFRSRPGETPGLPQNSGWRNHRCVSVDEPPGGRPIPFAIFRKRTIPRARRRCRGRCRTSDNIQRNGRVESRLASNLRARLACWDSWGGERRHSSYRSSHPVSPIRRERSPQPMRHCHASTPRRQYSTANRGRSDAWLDVLPPGFQAPCCERPDAREFAAWQRFLISD